MERPFVFPAVRLGILARHRRLDNKLRRIRTIVLFFAKFVVLLASHTSPPLIHSHFTKFGVRMMGFISLDSS